MEGWGPAAWDGVGKERMKTPRFWENGDAGTVFAPGKVSWSHSLAGLALNSEFVL